MPMSIPGGSEPGYLAFAIVDDLMDLLILKGAITTAERSTLLKAVATRLNQEGTMLGQRCSQFIANQIKP